MKKSSNSSAARARFHSHRQTLFPEPKIVSLKGEKPGREPISGQENQRLVHSKHPPYIRVNYSSEEINDFLMLMGAMLIIFIVHRFVPNTGAIPHSVIEWVKSTAVAKGLH